jgi:hypothetical protein
LVTLFHQKLIQIKKFNELLSGLSWAYATFFMLPLIIHEPAGFLTTLQRSSYLMRTYAGDKPKINYRYGFFSYPLRLLGLLPVIIGSHYAKPFSIALGIALTLLLTLTTMVIFNIFFIGIVEALYQLIAHNKIICQYRKKDLEAALLPGFSQ